MSASKLHSSHAHTRTHTETEFLLHFAWVIDHEKCIMVTCHVCVSVCLSAAVGPHYCTDPDVTWGSGRGWPLVVHYWADLQSVQGLRCYGNTMEMCGRAQRYSTKPSARHTHAAHAHYACLRRLPSPAITSTCLLRAPFHFVHTAGCCNANAKC